MTTLRTDVVAIWVLATLVGCTNPSSTPVVAVLTATTENVVPTATATTTIAPTSSFTPRPTDVPKPTATHTPRPTPLPTLPTLSREESRLPNVLTQFGIPSQIRFNGYGSTSHSDQFGVYKLRVEYEALQFAIEYSGTTVKDSTGFLACPMIVGEVIDLHAQPDVVDLPDVGKEGGCRNYTKSSLNPIMQSVSELLRVKPPYSRLTFHRQSTMPVDDARRVKMLTPKNGCKLPCWWGITPGITELAGSTTNVSILWQRL